MDSDNLSPGQIEDLTRQDVDVDDMSPHPSTTPNVTVDGARDPDLGSEDDDGQAGGGAAAGEKVRAAEDADRRKTPAKKRTKTGCITCRKRRIKCDETKPKCRNCIKSKRICAGYSQRVIFKPSPHAYQGDGHGPVFYPPGGVHTHGVPGHHMDVNQLPLSQSALPAIAPRPSSTSFQGHVPMTHGPMYGPPGSGAVPPHHHHFVPPPGYATTNDAHQWPSPVRSPQYVQSPPYGAGAEQTGPSRRHAALGEPYPGFSEGVIATPAIRNQIYAHLRDQPYALQLQSPQLPQSSRSPPGAPAAPLPRPQARFEADLDDEDVDAEYGGMEEESDGEMAVDHTASQAVLSDLVWANHNGSHHAYYGYATKMRSVLAFAHHTALATYIPTSGTSPLNDPVARAVFIYFISVTGPTMSLFERYSFEAPKMFAGVSPRDRVATIWTYTFPALSLNNHALMHAILALGSLQIATMDRAPPTAAMKHYHLALRKVAKNVRNSNRRTRSATLAATLLLGYFEVWSSDHSKWCNHIFGARLLIREIDLRSMTKATFPLKRMRWREVAQQRQRQQSQQQSQSSSRDGLGAALPDDAAEPDELSLDLDVINEICGSDLAPEDWGLGDYDGNGDGGLPANADWCIAEYEQFRDLFWWYTKMDIYQGMLGGTKLFMEYEHWTQCPPRGPFGDVDVIYGTYDHLLLLLGRLVSFSSGDLSRKTKAFSQGPPGSSPPGFPGIIPTHGKVSAPMGFTPPRESSPMSENSDDHDAEMALTVAMQEWTAISEAFDMFKARLGPGFQPLAPEFSDRRDSPFGPTLQYRTFSIAGIWMNYYMGLVHLHRTHPSMPPVAMMAAGMAAPKTAPFANEIGRIAAGLSDDCRDMNEIGALVAGAHIESCFCLFVAAIQYRDMNQRHWMVRRMYDIARLTGWQSSRQIADGCESGWIKAYQLGRGPPYERLALQNEPSSVWANPRRIDRVMRNTPESRLALVRSERTHYALGLLSVEQDLEKLELKEEPM